MERVILKCQSIARVHRPENAITRRHLFVTMTGAVAAAWPRAAIPAETKDDPRLTAWIFMQSPLERWMPDFHRTFDAWEDGGVRGIALGYMRFQHENGTVPSFPSNPDVYRAFGVSPPPAYPHNPAKTRQFHEMLDDAAKRGWEILLFGLGRLGGSRPPAEDPFDAAGFAATVQDAMNYYPQANGIIIDGPGEHHYELAFHHGGELLEIRDSETPRLELLGFDLTRLEKGIAHLRSRLHQLTPALVRYHSPGGLVAALALFDVNEDVLYWLRTRQDVALRHMAAIRKQIDGLNRKVKLGGIPRTAVFSAQTTQDYVRMSPYFDYWFPKHYFWHRGFDGMYGTIARWVQTIKEWNPSLAEEDCFAVVRSWFGIELPGVHSLADLEMGFPDEFFSHVVYSETRRALEAVGDPDKVIAWVSTGRLPHAGDPMPARDLHNILLASRKAGLRRFLFHPDPNLGAAEWSVISSMCGKRWIEDPSGYWPPDTPRPDSFNGARKRPRR